MDIPAKEEIEFMLPLPFFSIQVLKRLDDAHHSSFLNLPIQMLISFRNILTDTPRNNVLPAIWASLSPVKLTHKLRITLPERGVGEKFTYKIGMKMSLDDSIAKLIEDNGRNAFLILKKTYSQSRMSMPRMKIIKTFTDCKFSPIFRKLQWDAAEA